MFGLNDQTHSRPSKLGACLSFQHHSLPLATFNRTEITVVSHVVLFLVFCSFLVYLLLPGILFISSLPHQLRCNIKNQISIKFLPGNNHWLIPGKKLAFTLFFCNIQYIFLSSYFSCPIIITFLFSIMFTWIWVP